MHRGLRVLFALTRSENKADISFVADKGLVLTYGLWLLRQVRLVMADGNFEEAGVLSRIIVDKTLAFAVFFKCFFHLVYKRRITIMAGAPAHVSTIADNVCSMFAMIRDKARNQAQVNEWLSCVMEYIDHCRSTKQVSRHWHIKLCELHKDVKGDQYFLFPGTRGKPTCTLHDQCTAQRVH
jgi:hypothetical protein